jgi:two-component system, OmpR family, phosphate regulon response regulator PhoB
VDRINNQEEAMKKILMVEDHSDIRKLIRMTLEFEDFEIHEAADGLTGVIKAQALRPDLILMDVMMPGEIDGLQACRRIRADDALKNTPLVLLTARGQAKDREVGMEAGASAYLVKPFSPLELIDLIEKLLGSGE